jgi:transglutaminase-like putative cysteine protease
MIITRTGGKPLQIELQSGVMDRRWFAALGFIMSVAGMAIADNTGASAAWTSNDPLVVRAREAVMQGNLAEAHRLLLAETSPDAHELIEIIRRIRLGYGLDEQAMLSKLRKQIPDLTADDLARWRERDEIQFRMIDGRVAYFGREPANLFRFCQEAKSRRRPIAELSHAFNLEEHLKQVIAAAKKSGNRFVMPLRHRVKFEVVVPGKYSQGETVKVWLPFPQEHERQGDVKLLKQWPEGGVIAPNGAPHRSLFFEQKTQAKEMRFGAEFEYISWADFPILRDADAKPVDVQTMREYLQERPPHIRFTPQVRELVAKVLGEETSPLAKARKLFEWVATHIRYNAEEEYCIIPSLSERGLARLKGDCGVQATVFITLCRAAGIPARWQSGWETRPPRGDMHDWAEIYVEPWGWLPVDVSYGLRKSDDPEVRWFYFGHQDSFRMIVNLDYGRELFPEKRSMRSEPGDFQRGEVEVGGRNLYFDEWDYEMTFSAKPGE